MNKSDLIDRLERRFGSKKMASAAIEAVIDAIIREIAAGNKVSLTGFGTFTRTERAPRTGRNPHTGEAVPIPATAVPKFTPGSYFKKVVIDPSILPATGIAGLRASTTKKSST